MQSVAVGALVLALSAPAAGKSPSAVPDSCTPRFDRARDELISRGFAPTSDKDTRRWLRVDRSETSLRLGLEMRTSADGAATFYVLAVYGARGKKAEQPRWRHHRGKYCCDEHASSDDHLIEHRWRRSTPAVAAEVSIVEFEATQSDPEVIRWRDMFADVARKAADDCLAARR